MQHALEAGDGAVVVGRQVAGDGQVEEQRGAVPRLRVLGDAGLEQADALAVLALGELRAREAELCLGGQLAPGPALVRAANASDDFNDASYVVVYRTCGE